MRAIPTELGQDQGGEHAQLSGGKVGPARGGDPGSRFPRFPGRQAHAVLMIVQVLDDGVEPVS